jgi:hypothetical protein
MLPGFVPNPPDKGSRVFAYLRMYLLGGTLGHDDDGCKPATPNQFGTADQCTVLSRDSETWTTERFLG